MFKWLLFAVFILQALSSGAQIAISSENPGVDSYQVMFYKDKWAIQHTVKQGDNLFLLSHRYHVPPALLADINGVDFQKPLAEHTVFYIPVGSYNFAKGEPSDRLGGRPLFYMVRQYDNLFRLAHLAGVSQKKLQDWNGMPDNYITEGKRLFVGWVLYDASNKIADTVQVNKVVSNIKTNNAEVKLPKNDQTVIIIKKGKPKDTIPEIQKSYLIQTKGDSLVTEEKGPVVFFENKSKLSSNKIFFALHNATNPGTIIKVYNPGTDKTVYVKVLGPIPDTKVYHNSIIAIGSGAKDALMVTEDKAWCELKFAPTL